MKDEEDRDGCDGLVLIAHPWRTGFIRKVALWHPPNRGRQSPKRTARSRDALLDRAETVEDVLRHRGVAQGTEPELPSNPARFVKRT